MMMINKSLGSKTHKHNGRNDLNDWGKWVFSRSRAEGEEEKGMPLFLCLG